MIRSMTGYGRAEAVLGGRKYVVEIKSLNHRYLELSLRIPANLLPLEMEIKKKINEQLIRGKIDITIRRETYSGIEGSRLLEVNLPLVKNYYDLLIQLKDLFNLKEDITLDMMAGLKDVFIPLETLEDEITVLWEGLAGVLSNAIAALIDMRQKEGEVLGQDLKARLYLINEHLDEIDARAPQIVLEYQKRLVERIRELMD